MATNIPLGTYVQDGVRTGPFYTGQLTPNFVDPAGNGIVTSSSHNVYGPGVLLSPQVTYNIMPFAPGGAQTVLNNIVATQAVGTIVGAGNLPIYADGQVTTMIPNNGKPYLQFDFPRMVTVTVGTATAPVGTRVTIFGTDWYGMPLQHTYVISAIQTYPIIALGGGEGGSLSVPAKAFYTVNRVYISGAAVASTISLGAADVFGLPYCVNNVGDIQAIGWDQNSELISFVEGESLTAKGVLENADQTPIATAITGDVRGLYGPSTPSTAVLGTINPILAPVVGRILRVTSYVSGADVWQNQLTNQQLNAALQNPPLSALYPNRVYPVQPLTPNNLYGVPQFYTGKPS